MAGEVVAQEQGWQTWPVRARNYFDELKQEMRRVSWPSRAQVEATTLVVIISVFAFAAYFKLVDSLIEWLIAKSTAFFLSK